MRRLKILSLLFLTLGVISTDETRLSFAQVSYVEQYRIDGATGRSVFGVSVSGAGDVDGDGGPDFIVGDPGDQSTPVFGAGSASVFSGSNGSLIYTFSGDVFADTLGASVSAAGDVNGDGRDDVIVGSTARNNGGVRGYARVYSGIDGSVLHTFVGGLGLDDRFGSAVSGAGDVNGDGFADLIAGASEAGNNNNGLARVYSGLDGAVLHEIIGSNGNRLGVSVSQVGDINADGRTDLVIGASRDISGGVNAGSARVYSGADSSLLHRFTGSSSQFFGVSVSGAGDVNNDGIEDIVAGASVTFGDSFVRVHSGADGSIIHTVSLPGMNIGSAVSRLGDINSDGFDDFLASARAAEVGGMEFTGSVSVFSGFDGSELFRFEGENTRDFFGTSISDIGDINGDGLPDFIAGASGGGVNDGGYVRVFVSVAEPAILGDVNKDGAVTFFDIAPFIEILNSNDFQPEADVDQSGEVNFFDIATFIAILSNPLSNQ